MVDEVRGRVVVDRESVRNGFPDDIEDLTLSFIPGHGLTLAAAASACGEAVMDALDEHHHPGQPLERWIELGGIDDGIDDVRIQLDRVAGPDVALEFLTRLANHLETAGISGALGPATHRRDPLQQAWAVRLERSRQPIHAPTGFLYLSGWKIPRTISSNRPLPVWFGNPEAREHWAQWATTWAHGLARPTDPTYDEISVVVAGRGLVMSKELNTARLARNLPNSLVTKVRWVSDENGQRQRSVEFDPRGRLLVQTVEHPHPPLDWVTPIRELLIHTADHLEVGFIRLDPHRISGVAGALYRAPAPIRHPELGGYHQFRRHHDHHQIPDAYGICLVTDAHLANAHDLTHWTITPLGNGRHLLEHPHPEHWYTGDAPDPETLTQARHDFGNMITTSRFPLPQ